MADFLPAVEAIWASAVLSNSQKKSTINMLVCKPTKKHQAQVDAAPAATSIGANGQAIALSAEHLRLVIAKHCGVPCSTPHRATGVVRGLGCNTDLLRRLNQLNHAYTLR